MSTSKYLEHCTKVPDWMKERHFAIVTERNDIKELRSGVLAEYMKDIPRTHRMESLYELEMEAIILLQVDLHRVPTLAQLVPSEFIDVLTKSTSGENMAPRERAAIILIEADVRADILNIEDDSYEEFLRLKWAALNWLLEEGVNE